MRSALWNRPISPAQEAQEADWEALYERELPHVYNFFRYRVGEGPVAEDLTSATFEKAWRNRWRYRSDLASFATWLFAIARNTAVDYFRRRPAEVPLDSVRDLAGEESTEGSVEHRANVERLIHMLAELPERDRELLALKYGAEMTNRDIARLTSLSESNVGTILYRVVRSLRAKWDESLPGGPTDGPTNGR